MVSSVVDDYRSVTSSVVILLLGHYLVLPAGLEPLPLRSQQTPPMTSQAARMDDHPAALHLAVAYTSHTESVAVRTVNRTLQQLAPELATLGITLSPLYTALGDRFSAAVLANLCESWNSSTVLAALVLADHLPGLLPALAAVSAGVPVLWVTGQVRQGYLEPVSMSTLELRMEVSAREMLRALRSLLLQAHWHTFSLVSAVAHPLPSAALQALRSPPLQPLFRTLRPDASSTVIFRILSEISRATKGVVVLISDGRTARRIMTEAARLNMVAGNFVWIWIDSDAQVAPSQDASQHPPTPEPSQDHATEPFTIRRRKTRDSLSKADSRSKKGDQGSKKADQGSRSNWGLYGDRGSYLDRGLDDDRGLNVDRGLNGDRGSNLDRGLDDDRGSNFDRGLNGDRKSNLDRELNDDRGSTVDRGLDDDRRSNLDRGSDDDRGSIVDRGLDDDHVPNLDQQLNEDLGSIKDRQSNNDRRSRVGHQSNDNQGSSLDLDFKADQGSNFDRIPNPNYDKDDNRGSTSDQTSNPDRRSPVKLKLDWDSKAVQDSASLIKLELESIVNSVIKKQFRNSDRQSDIFRNREGTSNGGDKLRVDDADLENIGGKLRKYNDQSRNNHEISPRNSLKKLKINGDQLISDIRSNNERLKGNHDDESHRISEKSRSEGTKADGNRKLNSNNENYRKNDHLESDEQLELEMESMIKSVIDEQISDHSEMNSNNVHRLELRFDKLQRNEDKKVDERETSGEVRTKNISEKQLQIGLTSNSSLTPNSPSYNLTDSDNRLSVEDVNNYEGNVDYRDGRSSRREGEKSKPLNSGSDQVSLGVVRILKENDEEVDSDSSFSERLEVRNAQTSSNQQSPSLKVDSNSFKSRNQEKLINNDDVISIKSSEVEYFSKLKQKSGEVDEYKEYLCSSSSGVHEEKHKQDEICREFRIKKHQLIKTIEVQDEEGVKDVNNLATVQDVNNLANAQDMSSLATVHGKEYESKKSVKQEDLRDSDKVYLDINRSRTSIFRNSDETNESHMYNNRVSSKYRTKNGEMFGNRTIPSQTKSTFSSTLRRLRRNAKNNRQNVPKSTIPAKSVPARTFPANSGAIARENVTAKVQNDAVPLLPVGLLAIRPVPFKVDRHFVRSAVRTIAEALKRAVHKKCEAAQPMQPPFLNEQHFNCWTRTRHLRTDFTDVFSRELRQAVDEALAGRSSGTNETVGNDRMAARIQILNLVPEKSSHNTTDQQKQESREWRLVGEIVGHSNVRLDSIVWPGGHLVPASTPKGARSVFRVVTAMAPPFVMEGELDEDGQCLRGLECHRLLTSDKDNLTLVFNEMDRMEDADPKHHLWGISYPRYKYVTSCCYGLAMDLLENVAEELEFDFHLYVVADGMHGSRKGGPHKWNGVVGDLMSGAAHMSFAALSVNSPRSEVIDFSVPYFFSGVSLLAAPKQRTDIPLLAFLLPFSPELWIAIFTSLNVTAVAVAIYEWLSPFGLNPWGRQRSKNFSMSSAMWVCWGLLCGHLVAFKAPKSWPNKFLINVWGGFSVIFVASYTANIAALIAGLFFHNAVGDYHDRSLLSQRVATPKASAADYYIHKANQMLWDHVQKYSVTDVAEGVKHLKNGTLDILIADTPILDYYRATDNGCKLQKFGDTINEDTYAVGMTKGFPLKDSISAVMAKYSSNGYMDILQEKWYGGLPCFKLATEMAQPRPLGVAAVAGVFLLLGLGMVVGCLILLAEHLFYRYTLPILRHKPKGTIWRSRNIMFFSQKLYRFINCVELVSPHHAARELVHTIRQGQITSLFQKSVKRKEHEQRRRRRSKAQFFEMIQEIRRVQQEERVNTVTTPHLSLPAGDGGRSPRSKKLQLTRSPQFLSPPDQHRRNSRLPSKLDLARRLSRDVFRSKSSGNLRRMSSDISMGRLLDCHSSQAIGRRLSRDTNLSPPDINSRRASYLSDSRRAPSMDITGSGGDITLAPPKSPNYLTMPTVRSIPDNILTPAGLLPDASRFSYIDIKSPSFKSKLSQRHEPAGLSLSLGDRHPTSWSSSFVELNPRVIVCDNNEGSQTTNTDQKPGVNSDQLTGVNPDHPSAAKRPSIDHQRWTNNDQKLDERPDHVDVDGYSNAQKHTGDRPEHLKHSFDLTPDQNEAKLSKQSSWANSSVNSTEHMIQIIIPSEDVASAKDVGTSSSVTTIKSSPKNIGSIQQKPPTATIKSSPKDVSHQKPPIAPKLFTQSSAKVVAQPKIPSVPKAAVDQKMALNLVLNELKERCKEVNAAATDEPPPPPSNVPKIVSYIPKKPARKSLESAQRSMDDAGTSAAEKRRVAVEQQGRSLDRMGDRNVTDKPPPLPAKKERRRVHKVRSSECCEPNKCAADVACGGKSQSHATCDRTKDRRPLVTSRSNDEATSNRIAREDAMLARRDDSLSRADHATLRRHPVSMATLDRKDVTSSKTST